MHCSGVDTPMTKDGREKLGSGNKLEEKEALKARRAIARINYMAQDRADLAVAARVLSQHMSDPHEGARAGVKRVIRYLQRYPQAKNVIHDLGDEEALKVWTDGDWAGDVVSRRSCSGGCIMLGGNLMHHWSKTQQSVALSSGEAEMNGSVKAISEGIGLYELYKELYGRHLSLEVYTDSSACKGMILLVWFSLKNVIKL